MSRSLRPVAEALARPLAAETVPLADAAGRWAAADIGWTGRVQQGWGGLAFA